MKSIMIKRYKSQAAYQRDARRLAKRGYEVASVVSEQSRSGCMRILALGLFAWLFKPKPVLIVTFKLREIDA